MATPLVCATVGTFDGVHIGHQALLGELRKLSEDLSMQSAVITFDPQPVQVLQREQAIPQLMSTHERLSALRSEGFETIILLNFTTALSRLSAEDFMRLLKEKYAVGALLLGYDHRFGSGRALSFEAYQALGDKVGIRILRAEALSIGGETVSSSRIRSALKMGQLQEANSLLGRCYTLSGQVVGGMQIGRSLGYPTANIKVDDPNKLIPQDGVYAVRIWLERCSCGERYSRHDGMLYIGNRPTLGQGLERTIEVNIFELSANLYAERLTIEFVDYIRPNRKFPSLDDLQKQIAQDEGKIRALLRK